MRRPRRAAAICGLGMTLVMMSSSAAIAGVPAKTKPPQPLPAACKLVTQSDASTFLGVTVTQTGSGTSCDYAGDGGIAAVTVRLMSLNTANAAFYKKHIKSTTGATFPKLGDVASETIVQGGGGDIQVLKGKVLLDLSARKSDGAGQVTALDPAAFAAFARTAVAKL
jgi:hypothetical protein